MRIRRGKHPTYEAWFAINETPAFPMAHPSRCGTRRHCPASYCAAHPSTVSASPSWTPVQAPLPSDAASPFNSSPGDESARRASSASELCSIGLLRHECRHYVDNTNETQGLIETLANGVWTQTKAPLSADATTDFRSNSDLLAVACPAAGSCFAFGTYTGGSGLLIETLAHGIWAPSDGPVPANANGLVLETFSDGLSVSCSSTSSRRGW